MSDFNKVMNSFEDSEHSWMSTEVMFRRSWVSLASCEGVVEKMGGVWMFGLVGSLVSIGGGGLWWRLCEGLWRRREK